MTTLTWQFPVNRPHAGMLLGNGTQGVMIWGGANQLYLTIGRAGFWDHRFGNDFTTRVTYQQLRPLLEARDEPAIRELFQIEELGRYRRPHQLGGGRLVLTFPAGWRLTEGRLDLRTGTATVVLRRGSSRSVVVRIRQRLFAEETRVELPAALARATQLELVPAWEFVKAELMELGCAPPVRWELGFRQELPADEALTCEARRTGQSVVVTTWLGQKPVRPSRGKDAAWWREYWSDVPRVELPDPVLQEVVDYGLYKLAGATPPHGVACGLQGPWLEDYQLPPWSADYHFNINLQMIYGPLLAANRLAHFGPLWRMLQEWLPRLQANGRAFFGVDDALMLPHAVDDRCQVVGAFWTGSIDHGCTAWMAVLAWQYYRYGLDKRFLRELAWPLLRGAFGGYWAMMERTADGKLALPVSVSPEFRGSRMDAWGRNASFQLAACHATVRALRQAAAVLGEPADPRWAEVSEKLPAYTTVATPVLRESLWEAGERIALWEGLDLYTSHRHHSHLAGIYPFQTIDPDAAGQREIVANSMRHWLATGPGAWSGWCVPWAATLCARCGEATGAVSWLHWWARNYVNEGRGTLHDTAFGGVPGLVGAAQYDKPVGAATTEVMQLDAGCGALTAVWELLVQCRGEEIHVLPALPRGWRELRFDGVRTEGAFIVGATVRDGVIKEVRVRSLKGGRLRLRYGKTAAVDRQCRAGEKLRLADG